METRHPGSGMRFADALALQHQATDALLRGDGPEVVLLLEHAPVYTIMTRGIPHPTIMLWMNHDGQAEGSPPRILGRLTGEGVRIRPVSLRFPA